MFPKRTDSQHKGEIGINIVAEKINNELNLIFRKVSQEYDFGIDGYVDYVTENKEVTGGSVSVQIKCGKSYFKDEAVDGFWYNGTNEHLNFLLGQPTPVFIFLVDDVSKKVLWVHFNDLLINKSGKNWKILVPKENTVDNSFKSYIKELLSIGDYPNRVQYLMDQKDSIKSLIPISDSLFLKIRNIDIITLNTENTVSFFDSLKSDKNKLKKYEGKINIILEGYDDDEREIYEIPEVVIFIKKIIPEVKYWFYYMSKNNNPTSFLTVLLTIYCNGTKSNKQKEGNKCFVQFDPKKYREFMEKNFIWLNEMTEFLKLPMSENKRISEEIINSFDLRQ